MATAGHVRNDLIERIRSDASLLVMAERSVDPILVCGYDGALAYANQGAAALFGQDAPSLHGAALSDLLEKVDVADDFQIPDADGQPYARVIRLRGQRDFPAENFKSMFDRWRDGLVFLSPIRNENGQIVDFLYEYANESATASLTDHRGSPVGRRLLEVVPSSETRTFPRYVEVFETGQSHDLELHYGVDGLDGWWRNVAVKVGDRLAVAFEDITDRKRDEERLNVLLASIDDHFVSYDFEWRYTYVNDKAAQILGKSREELLGRSIWELFPGAVGNQYYRELHEARNERRVIRSEHYYPPFGVWFENRIYPTSDGVSVFSADITLRKTAEESLRESEAKFRQLADQMPAIVWVNDVGQPDTFVNRFYCEYTGLPSDVPGHLGWELVVHPEDQGQASESYARCLEEETIWEQELRLKRHDGEYRWHLSRAVPVSGPDGKVTRWIGTSTDIHGRKQVEQALRQSDERLRIGLSSLPIAVFTQDEELRYTWIYQPQLGYDPPEVIGKTDFDLLDEETATNLSAVKRSVLESGNGRRVEFPCRPFGVKKCFDLSIEPIRNAAGSVTGIIAASLDITEQKDAEARQRFLAELSERMRSLNEPQEIMSAVSNMLGEFMHVNRCAYAEVEADGETFVVLQDFASGAQSLVGRHSLKSYGEGTLETLRAGGTFVVRDAEEEISGPDLDTFRAAEIGSVICVPVTKNGRLVAGLAVHQVGPREWSQQEIDLVETVVQRCSTNIEQARLDQQVRELNEELEERIAERTAELSAAIRELEGFTYSVSHDLRAPLRNIVGRINILFEDHAGDIPSHVREELLRVESSAKGLGKLVDDLLDFSRLGRRGLEPAQIDLNALIDQVLEGLPPELVAKGSVSIESGLWLFADERLLYAVFENLLSNALKYSKPGIANRIQVGSEARESGSVIFVRDEGIGFDPVYADRIFLPFERLHREGQYPGSGIGLANVRRIVDRHGGRVWVESREGHGTCFYIWLPPSA